MLYLFQTGIKGLELLTFDFEGQHSNQLSYIPYIKQL